MHARGRVRYDIGDALDLEHVDEGRGAFQTHVLERIVGLDAERGAGLANPGGHSDKDVTLACTREEHDPISTT